MDEKRANGMLGNVCGFGAEMMPAPGFDAAAGVAPVLIVFDLDGTPTDSRVLGRELFKRVFAAMGYGDIGDALADSFNGPSADEVCRIMGIGADRRAMYDGLIDEIEPVLVREIGVVFPGVVQMLSELAPHAVLAILTNGSKVYCRACIEEYGFAPYIRLESGFVSGVSKSERMRLWAQEIGARRIICVGDRGTDVRYGREAGALTVGVTYGMGTREELEGADAICGTPMELAKTLKRMIGE